MNAAKIGGKMARASTRPAEVSSNHRVRDLPYLRVREHEAAQYIRQLRHVGGRDPLLSHSGQPTVQGALRPLQRVGGGPAPQLPPDVPHPERVGLPEDPPPSSPPARAGIVRARVFRCARCVTTYGDVLLSLEGRRMVRYVLFYVVMLFRCLFSDGSWQFLGGGFPVGHVLAVRKGPSRPVSRSASGGSASWGEEIHGCVLKSIGE